MKVASADLGTVQGAEILRAEQEKRNARESRMLRSVFCSKSWVIFGLLAAAHALSAGAQTPVWASPPPAAWTIPSNEEVTRILAERMRHNGVGIVVGIIDPGGAQR